MEVFDSDLSELELRRRTGDVAAVAGIRQVVLDNGVERGVRVVEMRTAAGLELELLVDRALDFGSARFRGVPFGWRSGNGFRHPGLHENDDEGGLSWLRSLDGLLVSGGLDHTLFGGTVDASQYRYPPKPTIDHGLHGRLTGIPARLIAAGEVARGDRRVLLVRGEVDQATSFGEHLRLTREVEVDIDGRSIAWTDTVENLGFERTPHMFLYHLNLGWPYLDEGAEFVAPIAQHLWESDSITQQQVDHRIHPGPIPGFVEQVREHELIAGPDGRHRVALLSRDGERGVELDWDAAAMPCFFQWQNLRDGQYALGLEPSTHHVAGDAAARADGSMIWLEHGDARRYSTRLRVLHGVQQTEDARSRIRSIGSQPGVGGETRSGRSGTR